MPNRIRFVCYFLLLGFLAVITRLFYWQILQGKQLSLLAVQQYRYSEKVVSERGKILSSDNYPLVMNKPSYLLFADPTQLEISPQDLIRRLSPYLGEKKVDLDSLNNKTIHWVSLISNLEETAKKEIVNLGLKGLYFEENRIRFYPEASISAQLLGFVGKDDENRLKGYFGIEGYYDKELSGRPGKIVGEKDALGRPLLIGEIEEEKLTPGRDIVLNLDRSIQFSVERLLKKGIEKYQAISGSVVIMDPFSGAIITMASEPKYDPANYFRFDQNYFRNPVISTLFEPGSVFKVIVMASALDAGVITKSENCLSCSGPRNIADYSIKTWNDKYYPDSTMTDILVHSDNVGMVYITEKLGIKKFLSYLKRFGLENQSGIDLQGEAINSLKEESQWTQIDLATASFGQGIALTPISILTAVSAIANGGDIYKPQVVNKIIDGKEIYSVKPIKREKAIKSETAKIVAEMMIKAVDEGEAKWAKPSGYRIAGKTGTAQIPIAGHYDPEKTIASFVGFAPADKPRFVMLVTLQEPKISPWGSETAAPLWFTIAREIFRLWGITPSNS